MFMSCMLFASLFSFESFLSAVGADGGEGPPVPIPNTVVKLTCVDNTWRATVREDRQAPTLNKAQ